MEASFSLPTTLQSDKKHKIRHIRSASVEVRVSTAQHRLRTPIQAYDLHPKFVFREEVLATTNNVPTTWRNRLYYWYSLACSASDVVTLRQRLIQHSRLKWSFALYCIFSLLFLSCALFWRIPLDMRPRQDFSQATSILRSPLQTLPREQLMAKLSSIYPPPLSIEPYFIRADEDQGPVTACLWSRDEDLDALPIWASRWKGHMSLLIATSKSQSSPEYLKLLADLQSVREMSSLRSKVSVHILHLAPDTPDNPNAFLNMARVLAESPLVALFPSNFSIIPPKTFYRSIASAAGSQKVVTFSMRQRSVFPFTALSPVLMRREDPLWCTERFFSSHARSTDWAECLFQIWLENFGDLEVKPTTDWIHELQSPSPESASEAKIHQRLRSKFRSETCVLATRQLAALRTPEHGVDTKKMRWLKRHCREWMTGSRGN